MQRRHATKGRAAMPGMARGMALGGRQAAGGRSEGGGGTPPTSPDFMRPDGRLLATGTDRNNRVPPSLAGNAVAPDGRQRDSRVVTSAYQTRHRGVLGVIPLIWVDNRIG